MATKAAQSSATVTPHVSNRLTAKPFVIDAIAASEYRFDSSKVAIREGQHVVLEFGPTQITVHDPHQPSPSECNRLGVILYSFGFSSWDKNLTMDIAADTGQVTSSMYFLFLAVKESRDCTVCRFCGKAFPRPKSEKARAEQQENIAFHLKEHRSSCPKCL